MVFHRFSSFFLYVPLLFWSRGTAAYLRVDATAQTHPVALAGLTRTGSMILRLRAPKGKEHMLMHAEAKAFLMPRAMEIRAVLKLVHSDFG